MEGEAEVRRVSVQGVKGWGQCTACEGVGEEGTTLAGVEGEGVCEGVREAEVRGVSVQGVKG